MSKWRDASLAVLGLALAAPALAGPPGRPATPDEIAAWDIDIRPDGQGLPSGQGSVAQGEQVYVAQCAACHGAFGEGADRWPALIGGQGSLATDHPVRTVGSFWPHATTLFDYIRRAMPHGDARSLTDSQVYAVTAYLIYLNDIVTDESFTLDAQSLPQVIMPNAHGFVPDARGTEPRAAPCQVRCDPEPARITARAANRPGAPQP